MPSSKRSRSPIEVAGSTMRGIASRSARATPNTSATLEESLALAMTCPLTIAAVRVTPGTSARRAAMPS